MLHSFIYLNCCCYHHHYYYYSKNFWHFICIYGPSSNVCGKYYKLLKAL